MLSYCKLRSLVAPCLLIGAAFILGFVVLAPARAASAIKQLVSFACDDAHACETVTNSSSGKAIVGVSQTNYAIEGRIKTAPPFNGTIFAGVRGDDASTSQTDYNAGVLGTAPNGTGVVGTTSFDSSNSGLEQDGTLGMDNSKTLNFNAGVFGFSRENSAVYGYANGVTIPSCPGVLCPKSGTGVGAESPTGTGVLARGAIGVAALGDTHKFPALVVGTYMSDGPLIDAFGGSDGRTQVLLLDHNGDLTIAGTLTQYGAPMTVRTTSHGDQVGTFAAQQTAPTMEDFGEAQLVEGRAIVRLDARFASAIDGHFRYLVFLTPQGDSNGLYVAQKTADAFVVREHNEAPNPRARGLPNVVFDYRIVAQPFGPAMQRLPTYTGTHDEVASTGVLATVKANLARMGRLPRLADLPLKE